MKLSSRSAHRLTFSCLRNSSRSSAPRCSAIRSTNRSYITASIAASLLLIAAEPSEAEIPPTATTTTTILLERYAEVSENSNAAVLNAPDLSEASGKVAAGNAVVIGFYSVCAAAVAGLGAMISQMNKGESVTVKSDTLVQDPPSPPPLPREHAVLVFGSTGRVGRQVVKSLLASGRTVIAAVRVGSEAKAKEVFEANGVKEGRQEASEGILFVESTIDVTKMETLDRPELWTGVEQVVVNLGAIFGPQPDGTMGYVGDFNPENVEVKGGANILAAMKKHMKPARKEVTELLSLRTPEEIAAWRPLDDSIMGGTSSSVLQALGEEGQGVRWVGNLIVEGGGFCGNRSPPLAAGGWDLSSYDGVSFQVKGDGSTFKLNIKTVEQLSAPECTYQATFDTVEGEWTNIEIPFAAFQPVRMASSDPSRPPLDPTKIATFGFVYSRFDFNKSPNPNYHPGPFALDIKGGIMAYKHPRPQIALLSSAGVERNAIIGNNEEARKEEIPIVRLNPGGVLNHKYEAEANVRSSSFPYLVLRSVGMVDGSEGGPFLLEADQGDSLTGFISRDEVAGLLASSLSMSESSGKTFEVRRSEAADGRGRKQAMTTAETRRLLLKVSEDRKRTRVGLKPFPAPVPPPPPATKEQVDEILVQVKAIQEKQKELVTASA